MNLLLVLIILYVVPCFLGVLLIRFILKKTNKNEWIKPFTVISFTFLSVALISVLIWDRIERTDTSEYIINDRFKCEVQTVEIPSFLDAPIEYSIEIIDKKTHKTKNIEFIVEEGYVTCKVAKNDSNTVLVLYRYQGIEKLQGKIIFRD